MNITVNENICLPREQLLNIRLGYVDRYLLLEAKEGGLPGFNSKGLVEELLPGGFDVWVEVGTHFRDDSYFDERRGKWKYVAKDEIVFARRSELSVAIDAWQRGQKTSLTHRPFAALSLNPPA